MSGTIAGACACCCVSGSVLPCKWVKLYSILLKFVRQLCSIDANHAQRGKPAKVCAGGKTPRNKWIINRSARALHHNNTIKGGMSGFGVLITNTQWKRTIMDKNTQFQPRSEQPRPVKLDHHDSVRSHVCQQISTLPADQYRGGTAGTSHRNPAADQGPPCRHHDFHL